MSAKAKLPPPMIVSHNLTDYRLTKKHKALLEQWSKMNAYMRLANKTAPCVRLAISDYADIDAAVRNQSDGKRELSQVTYRGVPILSAKLEPQEEFSMTPEIGYHVETYLTGRKTIHSIIAVKITSDSDSGMSYRVLPELAGRAGSIEDDWIDSSWFKYAEGFGEDHNFDTIEDDEDE